jgi:hypothetical protein
MDVLSHRVRGGRPGCGRWYALLSSFVAREAQVSEMTKDMANGGGFDRSRCQPRWYRVPVAQRRGMKFWSSRISSTALPSRRDPRVMGVSLGGGETPGYNAFIGYDTANRVTLVVWANLTVSPEEALTANALMLKVLDHIYVVSPLPPT